MANSWLRLWHDMPNDPKWRTIARISEQPISVVLAVYLHLLVDASRNVTRGHVDVTNEDLASALDVTEDVICSVLSAMEGRVKVGNELSGWNKRQPKREDSGDDETGAKSAAARKRDQRNRERAYAEQQETNIQVTQCHAMSRNVTLDKDKDKDKEELHIGAFAPLACPVEKILAAYHEAMPNNPRCRVLNEARKRSIRLRWLEAAKLHVGPFGYETADEGVSAWRRFFEVCAESDFLTGKVPGRNGAPPFVADIDFLFSPSGFAKCLENKYHREIA